MDEMGDIFENNSIRKIFPHALQAHWIQWNVPPPDASLYPGIDCFSLRKLQPFIENSISNLAKRKAGKENPPARVLELAAAAAAAA